MDLTTFSKETLIHMIEDQQKIIQEKDKLIAGYVSTKPMSKPMTTSTPNEIYNEDTLELETIDKERMFNYGSGPLRYKKGDTYYHGVGLMEKRLAWYKNWPSDRLIVEYRSKEHYIPNIEWDTHNAQEFCSHCKCDVEATRKRRVLNIYRCLGHTDVTFTA